MSSEALARVETRDGLSTRTTRLGHPYMTFPWGSNLNAPVSHFTAVKLFVKRARVWLDQFDTGLRDGDICGLLHRVAAYSLLACDSNWRKTVVHREKMFTRNPVFFSGYPVLFTGYPVPILRGYPVSHGISRTNPTGYRVAVYGDFSREVDYHGISRRLTHRISRTKGL